MPGRPGDDDVVPLDLQLAWQEEYCRSAGSPTAALLLRAVRDDLAAAGVSSEVLPGRTRFGDLLGLRIMAVLHRLAIERHAPAIAVHAPTLGGIAPDASANPVRERIRFQQAVIETIATHREQVRRAIGAAVVLKVILETGLWSSEQIVAACKHSVFGGADYVKTSTGFHKVGGASLDAVRTMRNAVGEDIGVKASGGIRTTADALAMIEAGASRIGASASRVILSGLQ